MTFICFLNQHIHKKASKCQTVARVCNHMNLNPNLSVCVCVCVCVYVCVCVCVCMCNFTPHCWFSLNDSETVKAVTLPIGDFVAFSNISLESYVTNLVSLSLISLQILGKTHAGGISDFQISVQSLVKVNCQSSRTSGDIDMKHDKSSKTTSKNLTMISCRQIVTSLSFFGFIPKSVQSGNRIPDA